MNLGIYLCTSATRPVGYQISEYEISEYEISEYEFLYAKEAFFS